MINLYIPFRANVRHDNVHIRNGPGRYTAAGKLVAQNERDSGKKG